MKKLLEGDYPKPRKEQRSEKEAKSRWVAKAIGELVGSSGFEAELKKLLKSGDPRRQREMAAEIRWVAKAMGLLQQQRTLASPR